jgi:ATP-dependent protease ClpP protease subunit
MSRWKSNDQQQTTPIEISIPTIEVEKTEKETGISQISGNKLYFYSDVTRDSIYALNRQIEELTKHLKIVQIQYDLVTPPEIELYISSEGGEVFSGLSAVDRILTNSIPINTHCEGIVASAATLISVVGKKRTISPNACMLVHQLSSGVWGTYEQFKDEMANLELIMKILKNIYLKHTKFQETDLEEMLKHDLCLEPIGCVHYGLVDQII